MYCVYAHGTRACSSRHTVQIMIVTWLVVIVQSAVTPGGGRGGGGLCHWAIIMTLCMIRAAVSDQLLRNPPDNELEGGDTAGVASGAADGKDPAAAVWVADCEPTTAVVLPAWLEADRGGGGGGGGGGIGDCSDLEGADAPDGEAAEEGDDAEEEAPVLLLGLGNVTGAAVCVGVLTEDSMPGGDTLVLPLGFEPLLLGLGNVTGAAV